MLIFETSGRFPFRTMRMLGWAMITLGFILLVLDVTDVAYTAVTYEDDDCADEDYTDWDADPCEHDDHIYAYIATGTWSAVVVLITGIIGARFTKWNVRHLKFQRDLYALLSCLCALLFMPAVIALHTLEIVYLKDMGAWYYDDNDIKTRDEVKFAVPLVILMIAGLIFIVVLMALCVSCCCAPISGGHYGERREGYGSGRWDMKPGRHEYGYPAPASMGVFGPPMHSRGPPMMEPVPMPMPRSLPAAYLPPEPVPVPMPVQPAPYALPRPQVYPTGMMTGPQMLAPARHFPDASRQVGYMREPVGYMPY